jgi:hypothetical protein
MPMAIQKAKTADRERELERIVDDWLDKNRDEREEKLAEETTEEDQSSMTPPRSESGSTN